jgi:hypothetical protein
MTGDGVLGAPASAFQATWVLVTSPRPSGRTAHNSGLPRPVQNTTRPHPNTGRTTAGWAVWRTFQSSRPVRGS